MKQILMTAEVSGQPPYRTSVICHDVLLQHAHPEQVAAHWVDVFIHNLRMSKAFVQKRVTFTLLTHEGVYTHRMVSIFADKSAEDLAKFWMPVVTKYISEN